MEVRQSSSGDAPVRDWIQASGDAGMFSRPQSWIRHVYQHERQKVCDHHAHTLTPAIVVP